MKNILIIVTLVFTYSFTILNVNAQTTTNLKNMVDSCSAKYDTITNRMIYRIVDSMPSYRGGEDTLRAIISRNLKWPKTECEFQGKIYVGFVIETDGRLTKKEILKGLDKDDPCGFNTEALNVLKFLTDWIPGKCHGVKVPVQFILPMRIQLQ